MHQLVQSAIDAANAGNNGRAQAYLKQVLTENPNDVDGWLVLAAIMENPERKRQCLNRVLSLDPTNQIAREELFEMDRAAMMGSAPQSFASAPAPQPVPPASAQQAYQQPPVQSLPPIQPAAASRPSGSSGAKLVKPLVFTNPLWQRLLVYGFAGFFWLATIAFLCASPLFGLMVGFMALVFLIPIWIVSSRVEVTNEGLEVSRLGLFKSALAWDDVSKLNPHFSGQSTELVGRDGSKLSISAQVSGYGKIIEIVRRKRPDLFNVQPVYQAGMGSYSTGFTGEKSFKRNIIGVILGYLIGFVFLILGAWGLVTSKGSTENLVGSGLFVVVALFVIATNLLAVQEVVVRPQQIAIIKNFGEEELTQNQVSAITLKTQRTRNRVNTFVVIVKADGGQVGFEGLQGGAELLYGTLMNWWGRENGF